MAVFMFAVVVLFWLSVYISLNTTSKAVTTDTRKERNLDFSPPQLRKSAPKLPGAVLGAGSEKFAVIIRCHSGYAKHLLSLLWALEAQTVDDGIYVIIAPTEYESADLIDSTIQRKWPSDSKISVRVLQLEKEKYDEHCCLLKEICTPEWRKEKLLRKWSSEALETYCTVNSPLHYFVTDSALEQAKRECVFCEYLVVTNADNYYSPDFFWKTSQLMDRSKTDIVLTNMLHRGMPVETIVASGAMDLGCVLSKFSIFLGSQKLGFAKLVPENAEPQDWHDADFWMVHTLQNKYNRKVSFLRETLFVHN